MAKFVKKRTIKFDPNYLFYYMLYHYHQNKNKLDDTAKSERFPNGQRRKVVFINLGGWRASKTYDEIHLIYKYCLDYSNAKKHIKVFRKTLVDVREKTLVDFKKCFSLMGLERDLDYTLTGDGQGGKPIITIAGNTIEFKGYPEEGVQEGDSDVVFINEILEIESLETYNSITGRCKDIVICDANPNLTEHFIFHKHGEFNTFYTNTTYLDNKHLPEGLQSDYEEYCPFMLEDSHIEIVDAIPILAEGKNDQFFNGFRKRVWDKPECKENEKYDHAIHRRINEKNIEKGKANKWWWYVFCEGLPAAREGAVFEDVHWTDKFPETGMEHVHLGLDLGFSSDPSVLTRVGVNGKDMFAEKLTYTNTATPEILFDLIEPHIYAEIARRKKEANGLEIADIVVVCDSSDKYKEFEFVRALQIIANNKGLLWQFVKCQKPNIVTRINLIKRFKLHLVDDPNVRLEQQNYIFMRHADGTPMNIPDPNSKWCHFWDSMGYVSWYFYRYYLNT